MSDSPSLLQDPARRLWLRQAAGWGVASALPVLSTRLWAAPASLPRFLLVFLRGAYDAHGLLVPTGSELYFSSRPTTALAKPDGSEAGSLALDGDWALAPAAVPALVPLWQAGQLAFVPFAGSADLSRSHFETQDSFELGQGEGPGRNYRSGFINRLAAVLGASSREPAGREVLAFTPGLPLSFQGAQPTANHPLRNLQGLGVNEEQARLIEQMYSGTRLAPAVSDGFETRREVMKELGQDMTASRGAMPAAGFEAEAHRIGTLMRERVALGFVDIGGWDTHANQGGATGTLATKLGELSRGMVSLAKALGPQWDNTVVVVASEFGRTFRENGTRGTDHGHGTVYWVLGGGVSGRKIAGEQVALTPQTLHQGRDMPVLTNYRAMLAALWARQYGLSPTQMAKVFADATALDLKLL